MKETNHEYFRSDISRGIKKGRSGVDRENKIIYGVAVMTKGFVKDERGWEIDDITLDQVVSSGNAHKFGMKSRFGHPNMSGTALGTFLGRAKNFRIDNDVARADLYLSDTASKTPDGDLATYVMDMAEKEPDMFGISIVVKQEELEYRRNSDGTREKDKFGKELPALLRVKSLSAVDIVDSPAANNAMFGNEFFSESVMPSAIASSYLDKFLESTDAVEKTIAFLERYITNDKTLKIQKKENENMKDLTLEHLKENMPDMISAIKKEYQESSDNKSELMKAKNDEKSRILGILSLIEAEEYKGMGIIAKNAIEKDHTMFEAESAMKSQRIKDLEKASEKPVTQGDGDVFSNKCEMSHIEKAEVYRKENGCSLSEALSATATRRK